MKTIAALLLATASLAQGCIFYVGKPAQTPHGLQDIRHGEALKALLQSGTTREQILLALGVPDRVADRGRTLLYAAPVTTGELWIVLAGPGGGVAGSVPLGCSIALSIRFDDAGSYAGHRLEVAGLGDVHVAARRALASR